MGNLLPSLGRRKLPMLEVPKAGTGPGVLRVIGVSVLTASGEAIVPKGATQCVAFVRGCSGQGFSANAEGGTRSGGGGAEEVGVFAVAPGQALSASIAAAQSGTQTTLSLSGKILVTANGATDITGAPASASGSPGADGGRTSSGNIARTFVIPGGGSGSVLWGAGNGAAGGLASNYPAKLGGGGHSYAENGYALGNGSPGAISLMFMGP